MKCSPWGPWNDLLKKNNLDYVYMYYDIFLALKPRMPKLVGHIFNCD